MLLLQDGQSVSLVQGRGFTRHVLILIRVLQGLNIHGCWWRWGRRSFARFNGIVALEYAASPCLVFGLEEWHVVPEGLHQGLGKDFLYAVLNLTQD
jgi:hypothetical protein